MSKKPVLHEILAVESGLQQSAATVLSGTTKTFQTKRAIFEGQIKSHQRFNDEEQHLVQAPEYTEVRARVKDNLEFLHNELGKYWDVMVQKDKANQAAVADIVVNGTVIATDVPATALLALEKKLQALTNTYNAIPTLDAARAWEPATDKGEGIYQTSNPEERFQSATEVKHIIVAPATDRHPAQVREVSETTNVGKFTVTQFSGCMSSEGKAALLQRLGDLVRAVKQARQRANQVEVTADKNFSKALFGYLMG